MDIFDKVTTGEASVEEAVSTSFSKDIHAALKRRVNASVYVFYYEEDEKLRVHISTIGFDWAWDYKIPMSDIMTDRDLVNKQVNDIITDFKGYINRSLFS